MVKLLQDSLYLSYFSPSIQIEIASMDIGSMKRSLSESMQNVVKKLKTASCIPITMDEKPDTTCNGSCNEQAIIRPLCLCAIVHKRNAS